MQQLLLQAMHLHMGQLQGQQRSTQAKLRLLHQLRRQGLVHMGRRHTPAIIHHQQAMIPRGDPLSGLPAAQAVCMSTQGD